VRIIARTVMIIAEGTCEAPRALRSIEKTKESFIKLVVARKSSGTIARLARIARVDSGEELRLEEVG
jgi:hypothetical protein